MIKEYSLSELERSLLLEQAILLKNDAGELNDQAVVNSIYSGKYKLPDSLKLLLREILEEKIEALLLKGIVDKRILKLSTPTNRREQKKIDYIFEIIVLLLMSKTGSIISYDIQNAGRVINDIIPIDKYKDAANSALGNVNKFNLHTEDAYHPTPPDFLSLFCIKNNEKAKTILSFLPKNIDLEEYKILYEPIFINQKNVGSISSDINPIATPILFLDNNNHYIRLNTAVNPLITSEKSDAKKKLKFLTDYLTKQSIEIVLDDGDFLIINNRRCVHGRDAFESLPLDKRRWLLRCLSRKDISNCTFLSKSNYIIL